MSVRTNTLAYFGGELRTSKEGFVNFSLITNSVLSTSTKKQRKSEGHYCRNKKICAGQTV
jgi:hypothetical protein